MNEPRPKSPFFYCIKIFGWRIYFTRHRLKHRAPGNPGRSKTRLECKKTRMALSDNHCEMCGASIDHRCSLHHLLPVGHPDRNTTDFTRVLCPACNKRTQLAGGIRHIITEGGAE